MPKTEELKVEPKIKAEPKIEKVKAEPKIEQEKSSNAPKKRGRPRKKTKIDVKPLATAGRSKKKDGDNKND